MPRRPEVHLEGIQATHPEVHAARTASLTDVIQNRSLTDLP